MPYNNQALIETDEALKLKTTPDAWRRWGPYVADRQWGTVREDYSENGDAWSYFTFDHANKRAYRWGEDGIAGLSDNKLRWCLSAAFWNGRDDILKERLFGLSNPQGNHGEDVKELYFYEDGVPSHSYMKMRYLYPQRAFPYTQLINKNAAIGTDAPEFELIDTGIFQDNRFFDIEVVYAKGSPDDVLMQITVHNAGPEAEEIHVLPHLWARNTWSWRKEDETPRPVLEKQGRSVLASHPAMPGMSFSADGDYEWLFCENETNPLVFGDPDGGKLYKDGINDFVVKQDESAISRYTGTKCAAHFRMTLAPGETRQVRMRWHPATLSDVDCFADFDDVIASCKEQAEDFYDVLQHNIVDTDARNVQRQALASMMWSKQYYEFDIKAWLAGDGKDIPPRKRWEGRNSDWQHLACADVLSMPDKWEYPWFAAWDLAFHAVTFALVDPQFAKSQLLLLVQERYMHPSGQMPGYEWDFSDANPPVHAWASWRVFQMDASFSGKPDLDFLERMFHKLVLNFTWWVNRKDAIGKNIFQGGFLGLDNIEIFDRSAPLPDGTRLDQPDATGWMAWYALTMMRIALELALRNRVYVDMAVKFFEHFLYIAAAMSSQTGEPHSLWNEEDGFYYDLLHMPDGSALPLRVRSFVGVIPIFAVHILEPNLLSRLPEFEQRLNRFLEFRPELTSLIARWTEPNGTEFRLLALLRGHRTKKLLKRLLNEAEFLSEHGIRAVSKEYLEKPFRLKFSNQDLELRYLPAESDSRLFGGNSNWRGPVWMPLNYLLVETLYEYHRYYGDDFRVEYPTGSGDFMSLSDIADRLSRRLASLSLRGPDGKRPVMQAYAHLDDLSGQGDKVLFHEYYNGDNGSGLGASHQTGWSGLVALLLQPRQEKSRGNVPSSY